MKGDAPELICEGGPHQRLPELSVWISQEERVPFDTKNDLRKSVFL